MNIKFKYRNVLRYVIFALGLLEKAKARDVELYFHLDTAKVCKATQRVRILAVFNIGDRDTKFPEIYELIFQCNTENSEDEACENTRNTCTVIILDSHIPVKPYNS